MKQSSERAVLCRVHRTIFSGHQRRRFFWWCCFSLQLLSAITAQSYSSSVEEGNDFDSSSSSFTSYENPEQCRGEWKHPPDCGSPPNTAGSVSCDYRAAWEYRDEDDQIVFTISTKNRNKWTGIGFSENQHMPETDAILGLVEESGRFFLMDSWLQAYEAPPLDPIQNLYNQTAWRENGITTLKFSRPRQTGDSRDYQFSDSACPYFVFPVMGGVFNAVNKRIRKHEATPVVSERRICVRSCRPPSSSTTAVISTSSSSSSSSSSTTTMAPTSTSKSSKSSASTTTPSSAGAAAGASSSSSVIPTTSKTTTGDDNGGGGEASGNEVVHGYSEPTGDSTTSTEDEHPTRLYRIELKMLHFNQLTANNNNNNNNVHSEEYQAMLATLEASLYQELKLLFDRVRRLEVSEVVAVNDSSTATTTTKDEHNQPTLVIFELTVAPKKASVGGNKEQQQQQQGDDTQSLTLALSSVIRDQRIGSQFTVDSGYLVVVRKDDNRGRLVAWINSALNSIGFSSRFTDDEQKWIIIGVGISALVLLALIQALCMFCRCNGGRDGDDNGSSGSFADRLRTGEDGYLDEKDNVDKQWKEYNSAVAEQYHHHHHQHHQQHYNGGGYNGYEEYGVVATAANGYGHNKSNSLHKNYGGGGGRGHHQEHYAAANYHPSLDRRQYEQQLMQQQHQQTNGRSRGHHNHSHQHEDHHHHHHRDHRHSNGRGGGGGGGQSYSMQPDYYFMPHQRKYSSDVVRVFVDYDHQ